MVDDEYFADLESSVDDDGADERQKSQPKHMDLVDAAIAQGFTFVNDMPAIPDGKVYSFGWDAVHRAMLRWDAWSTDHTRNEAIKTLMYLGNSQPVANHRFVGFLNGVLDVRTMKFYHGGEFQSMGLGVVPVVIPHDFDAFADKDEHVETLLEGISCGDPSVRGNLEETIGLAMSRYADNRAKAVWMYGTGENGKSTFLDALQFVVGDRNTCAMMLDDLKGQFNAQMIVGKLLLISDDQPAGSIDKAAIGTIKKLVTGQPVKVEQKGKDPYNATMFATIVVTSNEPPTFSDTTHGSLRRWHMVPLNANFGAEGSGRDIDLPERLHDEHAAQWMMRLGIDGLRRIIDNEGMTPTQYSTSAIQEAKERSNSVYAFLAEHPREELLAYPNAEVWYWRYAHDAKSNRGSRPFEMPKFVQMVDEEYGFETAHTGRYKAGDPEIGTDGIAHDHGKHAGDRYRKFVEKQK